MIAKRIMAPKGGAGFLALSRYVVNARVGADPASWQRLNAYILDENGTGEKVAWSRVTNCVNDDPGWGTKEILLTQAENTRSRSDKSYHLVVSFPEGERPTREQLADIEDRLVAAIGFGEHQRVSAVHQNTDNWHLHVAINKVHPQTHRNVAPFRDHFRLQAACAELEIRHGLTRELHTENYAERGRVRSGAEELEARAGVQSFAAWTRENTAGALLAARDAGKGWQHVHCVAAAHGLEFRLRGAGLVIGHREDGRLNAKASAVDRALSFKSMTKVLGQFEVPGDEARTEPARQQYQRPHRSGPLFERFRAQHEAALQARKAAMHVLRARHLEYAAKLSAWHRERIRRERLSGTRGSLRREAFQHLAEQRQKDRAERIEREAQERRAARQAHPIPSWHGFLEAEAVAGNTTALATLRGRRQRAQRVEAEIISAGGEAEARHVVHRHLRPAIRRDGRVIYRLDDGGLVSDEARQVRVAQATAAATFLALELAADRFGGRPLVVRGTDAFREQAAQLAGAKQANLVFADAGLEKARQRAKITAMEQPRERDGGLER